MEDLQIHGQRDMIVLAIVRAQDIVRMVSENQTFHASTSYPSERGPAADVTLHAPFSSKAKSPMCAKARSLLMLALTKTSDAKEIQRMFYKY